MTASPPADQTALRDRIAAALYDHSHPGWAITFPDLDQDQRDTYLARADAVLAVLPAPVDRAAVLREAADVVAAHPGPIPYRPQLDEDGGFWWDTRDRDAVVALLRRVADETAATETPCTCFVINDGGVHAVSCAKRADETAATGLQPRRGDQVEAWLKAQRDDHRDADRGQWTVLDNLLDRYRLHADTGTPLGEHVCEGRVVGDCECLEQPAAGARQDGAQP